MNEDNGVESDRGNFNDFVTGNSAPLWALENSAAMFLL
jgi:hypothetical protein